MDTTPSAPCLPRPGLLYGAYPQRPRAPASGLVGDVADLAGDTLLRPLHGSAPDFDTCLRTERRAARTDRRPFGERVAAARAELARFGLTPGLVARSQWLVAQAVEEVRGLRPYRTQHQAAWAMLRERLVEMDTGEGKSLALLMAAATAGMAGMPVHVVTANDYLAGRDAAAARPVLERLGLRVAAIVPALQAPERHAAYACDVVYCTARELGFDYLRDQLVARHGTRPLLRGLCLALIDEADSVLIDHARTPLVIATPASQGNAGPPQVSLSPPGGGRPEAAAWGHSQAGSTLRTSSLAAAIYEYSGRLQAGSDFTLVPHERRAEPTAAAIAGLQAALAGLPQNPGDPRISALGLAQALVVRHLLQRDRHYVVQQRDGTAQIVLIDETTGRVLPGTTWTGGIQDYVAVKESCDSPQALRTAQQISLQRLFSRYWKLGGISGTLRESRLELFLFYRLRVQRIEPRRPSRRRDAGLRLFADRARQFDAVLASVQARRARGQPVLVGTDSIASSEALATHLQAAGLRVTVLNARHDAQEAQLIARAGWLGAVTVTTNMAGRGTDIELDPGAAIRGLHVIACSLNASRRIDRQLLGRSARNGQPGSCETLLALDDGVFDRWLPAPLQAWLAARAGATGLPPLPARWLARGLQALQETSDLLQRWRLVQHEQHTQDLLAYTGGRG
jgi:preprotein translocase subunit SecA